MAEPFGSLKYLYLGSKDFERDFAYYKETLGATLVWNFSEFGARVAAFRLGEGPLALIADHRPAGTCIPVYGVADLKATTGRLKKQGWKPDSGPFGIPDGPCYLFSDPSKNQFAVFQNDRPDVLTKEYQRAHGSLGRAD